MKKRHVSWLYAELPGLVGGGVLDAAAAERLRAHYGPVPAASGRRVALTVCSILGAVLVGAGIILLLAHNWSGLSRAARTVVALAPLAVAQGLAVFGAWRGRGSIAWREGVGIFLCLAVAAAIALVGQTYHIPGDLGGFLLVWAALILPAVYLLDAVLPAVLYLAAITGWAGYAQSVAGQALGFWPLFALAAPFAWQTARRDPYSPKALVLEWAAAIVLCIATGISLEKVLPGLWIVVYAALLPVLFLAGTYWFDEGEGFASKPLQFVGGTGVAVLALLLTYDWPWHAIGWSHWRYLERCHAGAAWVDYLLAAALPAGAAVLSVMAVRRGHPWRLLYGALPLPAVAGYAYAAATGHAELPVLLFNVYLLALGVGTLVWGVRSARLGVVNAGMLIVAALVVARFFDEDLGFVARGVAFIALGLGFLVTNLVLLKRMKTGGAA